VGANDNQVVNNLFRLAFNYNWRCGDWL